MDTYQFFISIHKFIYNFVNVIRTCTDEMKEKNLKGEKSKKVWACKL